MENIGDQRTISGQTVRRALNSPSAITFENNKKILDQPQAENGFSKHSGGETGIRTLGTREGSTVFETAPFDHSGTSPHY